MKKIVMAVVIVAVVLTLTAWHSGQQSDRRVGVVGDSITWLAAFDIQSDLSADYAPNVADQPGDTFAQGQLLLKAVLTDVQGAPEDVIFNLGTDDVVYYNSDGDSWEWAFARDMEMLESTPCVILVTVNTEANWYTSGDQPVAQAVNAAESNMVASHPNFHLLDWNGLVQQGDNYDQWIAPGPFGVGGIHPVAAGATELAGLYTAALQQDCPS